MKQFILVLMLVIIASSETVKPSADTMCACDKIKSQADCKNVSTCFWTAAVAATDTTPAVAGSCGTPTTPTTPTAPPAHCPQVTEPATNCWKTLGCAYVDSKCTHFTGCTAYVKTTNSDCQAISKLCITDGTQCTDAKSCNEYTLETQCTVNASVSGILKCKWDNNACRDYVCTEADTTLATNAACSAWLSGCVTTGKGCIATLQACASYTGDDVACSGLKGTDGNCEGTVGGTNCTARVCSKAAATVVTDADCATYQVGCITNGKGCVASPLPACATYLGDNTSCVGYIGSDGTCEGDAGATNCRSRTCTNAPASNNTDALCAAYRAGCVTTGKGCVSSKGACAGYSGTTTSCVGYIGTDGFCKGSNATTSSACSAKVCTDAPTTTATDAACASYQVGCKTTGKGCIAALGLCSSYTGTITTCEGMIGSDGKCKGTSADTPGSCSLKVCTDAPTSTSTNEACAAYQTGCVTTGAGCVSLVSCQSTIKSISCTGTSGCGWNNICVASRYCSDFLTVSICNGNNAILVSGSTTTTTPCFWTGSACRPLACTDAPNTYNTDSLCNTFLAGCVTKGNGCLAPTAACSSFFGSKTTCLGFTATAKCTNTDAAGTTTACINRQCIDDTASTTNSACDSYLSGCRTKGTGCIEPTKLCSDYTGTQAECDNFIGNSGTNRCWNASSTGSAGCINKTCAHLASAASDTDCGTFLSGCLFNGIGCTEKANSCTSYTGTQTQCGNFKGVNQTVQCWSNTSSSGQCTVKSCGQAPITTTTNEDCETFLTGCLTNGGGCVSKTASCSSYSGNITTCEGFIGNSKKCSNKDSCTERVCDDKKSTALGGTSPGTTNTECTTYLSTCRYFNGGCVNYGICTSYAGDSLAKCQDALDNNNKKCWWKTSGTTCISRACVDAPTVTSSTGCTDFLSTCVFNGSICLDQGACASYTAFGTDDAAKQSNCGQMKSSVTTKFCWFVTGQSTCTDRTCANAASPTGKTSCDTHIGDLTSCWWNGTACQATTACASYTTSGANDPAKLAICQAIKDNTSPTSVACYWTAGSNCVSKSCSNVPTPISGQSSCESHLPGKCAWNGSTCVAIAACNTYSPNGADDAAKKTICEALSDTVPKKCTFIIGMSTCTDRTCSNIATVPSATECSNWLSTCYWNGKFCEPTQQACSAYTPFGVDQSARATICGNMKDNTAITPLNCTQMTYTAPTVCAVTDCTTISTPVSLVDCTRYSQACRWPGYGTCVNATACASYTITSSSETTKCQALTDSYGNKCGWITGTACYTACENKTNATNQDDCTAYNVDCRYVGVGTCVYKAACNYSVSGIIGDPARKTACENALAVDGTTKCAFLPGAAVCIPRAVCTDASYAGTSAAICQAMVDTIGKACGWTAGSVCIVGACTDKTNATSQADCTAQGAGCRYVGVGTCVASAACNYNVSALANDAAKKTACENATAIDGTTKCAFLPGANACIPRAACTDASYAGTTLAICQAMVDINGKACGWTSGSVCIAGACADRTNATSQDDCSAQVDLATCKYVGVGTCVAQPNLCTGYTVSGFATDALRQSACLSFLGSTGSKPCSWVSGATCVDKTCAQKQSANSNADCQAWLSSCRFTGTSCIDAAACATYAPTGTDAQKRAYCQGILDNTAVTPVYCSFIDGASNCSAAVACTSYTATASTDLAKYDQCRALKDTSGNACVVTFPKCEARTCANITPTPTSQTDCTSWKSSCRFTGNVCVEAIACTYTLTGDYNTATKSDDQKKALCNSLEHSSSTSSTKVYCTLTTPAATGTVCIPRTCENVYPAPTTDTECVNWLSTCTLHGSTCNTATACGSYALTGVDNTAKGVECRLLKNASGTKCGFSSSNLCEDRTCANAPTPSSDTDCSSYLDTCTISNAAIPTCILKTSECTSFSGLPNQCQSFTGNSKKCWSVSGASTSTPASCKVKECTDNSTATTNDECNTFLPTCKTSGLGCVASTVACINFSGNSSTCATFKTTDGTNLCRVGTATADPCNDKACSDDASSTTDAQCKSFMSTCLTKGTGCIDSDAPCSKYQGTQAICQNFVGAGKKCWNLTSVTNASTYCVDKKCSDDDSSTTNAACESSLTGCLTKGTGCIENTAACGSYQGTQSACSAFRGSNGTKLCWNTATATDTTPCTEKACGDNTTATSDADCETFLPKASTATDPKCVTNGAGCVDYPRSCSQFTGTLEKCGTFKASDGPCKTTATGSITASGTCAPRVCAEALNSLNTDALCSNYHPSCVTTGYGCVVSVACSTIQEKNSCSAKVGCSWVNNCRSINADCSSLTTSGASICVNTPVSTGSKKCSWYNGTTCRAQTCDDLPATLVSHDSCKAVINTCTTTGSGCITMGNCSAYATEVICKAAKTTQAGDTCIWDTTCRAKKCTDAPTGTTTDAGCDTYLTGCKTNGTSCVASVTCPTLLTAAACQVDGSNKPCLYVNNTCYSYAKCEDAIMTTHSACQSFSPLCTTSGDKCIAITSCAKTVLQLSCVVGTDGSCGWLPANGANAAKCQKFGACSDAAGADNASCAAYGSNCITDGTKCVDKGTCSTYLTQPSCDYGGTDGVCQFTSTSNSCRLRECTDATATNASGGITSHSGCYGFTAKTKCTTNGTSCIQLGTCASYTVEAGCAEGTDGLCVYDFPVGQTTGTKACRVKVCGDFKFATSAACSVALTGAGLGTGCVSDGTNCIVKAACSSYTSKEACNGGGSDGLCAFTPGSTTTPTVGTCKLMTACTDANSDSVACNAKSSVCNWQVSTSGTTTTTTCNAHTCTSKASGSTCNPVPSYDSTSYTVCGPATTGGCTEVAGSTLLATTCQSYTLKTYTWNETTSTCTACFTSTNTDPGNNGGTGGGTTTTDGNIIKSIATLVILAILVA